MQIALTGGSGRIGRAIAALALEQGHHVVSIDRIEPTDISSQPKLSFVQADVAQYEELERAFEGCDALIHMAAIPAPGRHPDHVVHNNNVVGSYNALRAAAQLGITRVCQASSINAIGGAYSRWPRYDYFPLDEQHPTYNEDPYSLSKWICEIQGDSFARRYAGMTIASLRFHGIAPDRATAMQRVRGPGGANAKHLWGYTRLDAAARGCMDAITADYKGHEVFYIVAPDTVMETPSHDLARQFYPDVPVRNDLGGTQSFFDCTKAERLLHWTYDDK